MLMILDGWGVRPADPGNAVYLARTPNLDRLLADYPCTQLQTSGPAVGLPEGVMGNSEVGHLNIGAGRIVYQDLLRIDRAIEDGSFFTNPTLNDVCQEVLNEGTALHLIGLASDGGVHSQLSHLYALLDLAKRKGIEKVFIHAILDGRDTAPDGGAMYIKQLQTQINRIGVGTIATICGRYYAMDRDTRWERTEIAYRLYTQGVGSPAQDPLAAIETAYDKGETDEFVKPIVLNSSNDQPVACIENRDSIVFFNFRADRTRQLTRAFTETDFDGFKRGSRLRLGNYLCMTLYDQAFNLPVAFPPIPMENILGEIISAQDLKQLRIAETEKYAHVTYFFNGGEETPFKNEDRCLIPSPRDIATYDQKPEMSAIAVTEEVLERIASDQYDLIILNFANMDMVGHTGVIEAAIKACQTVDFCIGRIVETILSKDGAVLITADHGNAETMIAENGHIHTAHTTNPVHLVLVSNQHRQTDLRPGVLGDIAPTILDLMAIEKPPLMTGRSLIKD
jgi:2,3-bisphosphoglycerate-independent phosphoglycerate mutase